MTAGINAFAFRATALSLTAGKFRAGRFGTIMTVTQH
jgi:hypothetical protein